MTSAADSMIAGLKAVTKIWTKQRKAEERHAAARQNRHDRLVNRRSETIRDVAWDVMEKAYLSASSNGTLPANATQIMYAARPEIQRRTGKKLNRQYFNA